MQQKSEQIRTAGARLASEEMFYVVEPSNQKTISWRVVGKFATLDDAKKAARRVDQPGYLITDTNKKVIFDELEWDEDYEDQYKIHSVNFLGKTISF